jgi:hypothetical protein
MAEHNDDKKRSDEVLGIRDVTPDRPAGERLEDHKREGVGTAGEVERTDATGSVKQTKGATGIDMGAGGEGTGIEP